MFYKAVLPVYRAKNGVNASNSSSIARRLVRRDFAHYFVRCENLLVLTPETVDAVYNSVELNFTLKSKIKCTFS